MSQTASKYERLAGDKYFTPAWVTESLLSVEHFGGGIWDPAAGAGHMLDVFGCDGLGTDIAPDRADIDTVDFLTVGKPGRPNIVTNPPYGTGSRLAVRFIDHALALTEPVGGKVAMLLKVGFDSAGGRRRLFADHPAFAAEYRLTTRIRWANLEQSTAGPTENHSWFVWDWRKRGGPADKAYLPIEGARS